MTDEKLLSSDDCPNQYERIMVAAREARRLNDYYRNRNLEPKVRVTTEAIDRVFRSSLGYSFGLTEESDGPTNDAPEGMTE